VVPAGFCLTAALFVTKTAPAPGAHLPRTRRDFAMVGRTEFDPVRQRFRTSALPTYSYSGLHQ
jgi:hypothetical protein